MTVLGKLFGKESASQLKLMKEPSGEWVVKKGSSVLYIGTKEKCKTFMSHTGTA